MSEVLDASTRVVFLVATVGIPEPELPLPPSGVEPPHAVRDSAHNVRPETTKCFVLRTPENMVIELILSVWTSVGRFTAAGVWERIPSDPVVAFWMPNH